jgi:hybrid cluster-associated redox disulfide protein
MADKITGEMSIMEIVQKYPETVPVFVKHGLHCLGCAIAQYETLAEGAAAHGMDLPALLKDLNEVANKAGSAPKKAPAKTVKS